MLHVFSPRCSGKTVKLIRYAVSHDCDILVSTSTMAECVLDTAVYIGVTGKINRNRARGPISIGNMCILIPADLEHRDGIRPWRRRPILIDDMDLVIEKLCHCPVAGYSVTYPAATYGDDLNIPLRGPEGDL